MLKTQKNPLLRYVPGNISPQIGRQEDYLSLSSTVFFLALVHTTRRGAERSPWAHTF
jgi:hypothetical protein